MGAETPNELTRVQRAGSQIPPMQLSAPKEQGAATSKHYSLVAVTPASWKAPHGV